MNYISDIKLETNDAFNVIIEIPIGTNHKYELADGTFDRLIDVRKYVTLCSLLPPVFPASITMDFDAFISNEPILFEPFEILLL